MEPFLRHLATLLVQDHGKDLADVAVVLPSQRAGLYLRRHLADVSGTTIWSPQVLTLSGLVERISGLRTAATTDLLFDGHAVLRTLAGQQDVPIRRVPPVGTNGAEGHERGGRSPDQPGQFLPRPAELGGTGLELQ